MKILLMEKFDGISSEIPLWNGRHPSLTWVALENVSTVTFDEGFKHYQRSTSTRVSEIILNCDLLSSLDPNKRYSFLFNGLKTDIVVEDNKYNSGTIKGRKIVGQTFDPVVNVGKVKGRWGFDGITGNTGEETFNLELVYAKDKFSVYVNGLLKATLNGQPSNPLIYLRSDANNPSGNSGGFVSGGPELWLKEFIIVELDEGEIRVGNVRLERLPVATVSENLPSPENITPVNLANNTFSQLDQDSVVITVAKPAIVKNEKVIGVDYRVSAVGTIDGSQMRVKLNDGSTDIESKVVSLPMSHTRDSSCHIVQAVNGGDLPSDYDKYSIVLEATEDES